MKRKYRAPGHHPGQAAASAEKFDPHQLKRDRRRLQDLADRLPPISTELSEREEARAIWWRQAALGHRMPAERGVILIEGRRL